MKNPIRKRQKETLPSHHFLLPSTCSCPSPRPEGLDLFVGSPGSACREEQTGMYICIGAGCNGIGSEWFEYPEGPVSLGFRPVPEYLKLPGIALNC